MTFDIKYNSVNKDLIEMLTLIVLDCVYIYIFVYVYCMLLKQRKQTLKLASLKNHIGVVIFNKCSKVRTDKEKINMCEHRHKTSVCKYLLDLEGFLS